MAGLYGLGRHFYDYLSDNGNHYCVGITDDDAGIGGFGSVIAPDSLPALPKGFKMRIQYGTNTTSGVTIVTKWPVKDPTSTQWVTPVAASKNGVSFVPTGSRGEKRFHKS